MTTNKIAFEAEFIIWDYENQEVSTIDQVSTNIKILSILEKKYPKIVQASWVQQELDSCQIEIANTQAHENFNAASEEICDIFEKVEECVKNDFWLKILPSSIPSKSYLPHTTQNNKRYAQISEILSRYGNRKSTNIAGIHMHIDTSPQRHILISKEIWKIFRDWNLELLWMSQKRLTDMEAVITSLYKAGVFSKDNPIHQLSPVFFNENYNFQDIIDVDGIPKDSYNLVSLKSPTPNKFTSEVRSPDTWGTQDQLYRQMKKIHSLITSIIQ